MGDTVKNKEKGVFWGYLFSDKLDSVDLIAPFDVKAEEASIFGHRKKCDSSCSCKKFTEREWLYFYREATDKTAVASGSRRKRRKSNKERKKGRNISKMEGALDSAGSAESLVDTPTARTKFEGLRGRRVYCPDCAKKHNCNSYALQSGLMVLRAI